MADLFRTQKMDKKYAAYRESGIMDEGCALCAKTAIKDFTYWKIVRNDFPYDLIAKTHDMIVPLRHISEGELSSEEKNEFNVIKKDHLQQYDYIIEATPKMKSIPEHFHLHLIVAKEAI